jgi:hypothetical protein
MEHIFWEDDVEDDYCIGTRSGKDGCAGDGKLFRVVTNCKKTVTEFRKNDEGIVLKTTTTVNISKVTEEADEEVCYLLVETRHSPLCLWRGKGSARPDNCHQSMGKRFPLRKPPVDTSLSIFPRRKSLGHRVDALEPKMGCPNP